MTGSDSQASATETFGGAIQHQVKLSWGKAIEISYNTVRVRFARSMITAAGVVLAITFLMATLTRGATVRSMKEGVPASIELEKQKNAAAEVLKQVKNAVAAGLPLKKVAAEVDRADYALASSLIDQVVQDKPDLAGNPQITGIQAALENAVASAAEVKRLERLQRQMNQLAEGGGAAQSEQAEARARERWLIALALLVAFVGIMNSMLMSVTERFREIGTMKCLGALDSFIVKLFLIESSMQGFLGTMLGVVLGLGLSLMKLHFDYGAGFWAFLPAGELGKRILLAMICGTFLAVAGALYPARVAAKMEPVVAMRVDQ